MIIVINDNLVPKAFHTLDTYKIWCIDEVKRGINPDLLLGNCVYEVLEGEEANENNYVNMHEFHINLYKIIV